jgi:hypothetical protein
MTAKKEGATKKLLAMSPQRWQVAKTLHSSFVGGVEASLDLTQTLVEAAAAGDEDASRWLAKAGISTATASNGVAIVINKNGTIGAFQPRSLDRGLTG